MKVKQLEADYWLFNIIIYCVGYWNFENNRSINRLFGEKCIALARLYNEVTIIINYCMHVCE